MKTHPLHSTYRDPAGPRPRRALRSVSVAWSVGVFASCASGGPPYLGPSPSTYVETLCPGQSVAPIPTRGPDYSDVGGRVIRRTSDSMTQNVGGVDLGRMDSNWSSLACEMTVGEVDGLISVVYSAELLAEQSMTGEVVLFLGARQLVFQDDRLVKARGPAEIGLPSGQ